MATRPLIKESLFILNICGLNPTKTSLSSKLTACVVIASCVGLVTECLLNIVFNWKGFGSIDGVILTIGCYQVFIKAIIMIIKAKPLKKILRDIDQYFWSTEKYSAVFRDQITSSIKFTRSIMIIGLILPLITDVAFGFKPMFSKANTLPIPTYHPTDLNKSPNYQIAWFIQVSLFVPLSCVVLGIDFLFMSLIVHIVNEFRMISKELTVLNYGKNSDEASILKRIKLIVEHHEMVLSSVTNIKETYSFVLLNQFLLVLSFMCICLLSFISNTSKVNIVKSLGLMLVYLFLSLLYCVGGTYLAVESEKVAFAAYQSGWWMKTQPKVRKSLGLIMQRAQKCETLTAGGMIEVNLETFTDVVKTGYSFFTVMQATFTEM